jgi:hypothetical protein
MSFMSAAGPPVEAAITTIGKRAFDLPGAGGGWRDAFGAPGSVRGAEFAISWPNFVRTAVRNLNFCRQPELAVELLADIFHVEINAARRLCYEINSAKLKRL